MIGNRQIMKKRAFVLFGSILFVFMCVMGMKLFNQSYAAPVTKSSKIPTEDFVSNYTGGDSTINFISDSLSRNPSYSNYLHNFNVVPNYRVSDNSHPLYTLMKNLTFPAATENFEMTENNPIKVKDRGVLYILSHGYNSTNTTNTVFSQGKYGGVSDNSTKEYITQIALWLYLFENKNLFADNYCAVVKDDINSCDFYIEGSTDIMTGENVRQVILEASKQENYVYLNYILQLVDEAEAYREKEVNSSAMTGIADGKVSYVIDKSGEFFVTEEITPTPSENVENYMNYSVSIHDPNKYGVYLIDNDNQVITNMSNLSGSFKIYVPLQKNLEEMDLSSVQIQIIGQFVKLDAIGYHVTSSSNKLVDKNKKQVFSDVLLGYVPTENASVGFSLGNFTRISKVDATNEKELPGASLTVTNKNDSSKSWTWVSGDSPHYLSLSNGEYQLCETLAPEGYMLNTTCIDFTVDGNKVTTVQMKNNPKVYVPNTSSFLSRSLYIVGGVLVLLGLGITSAILWKKKKVKH